MSRRNQATVNFYLRTSKPLSNGTCSIMLRVCFHGFKDRATGYSCQKKYWDVRNQVVKKGENNFGMINYELGKLKSSIISKRDEMDRLGIAYTPSILLSLEESKKGITNVVSDIIDNYVSEKELRGSVLALATLLGRSINSISTYVQQLTEEEDLVDAVSIMDDI